MINEKITIYLHHLQDSKVIHTLRQMFQMSRMKKISIIKAFVKMIEKEEFGSVFKEGKLILSATY